MGTHIKMADFAHSKAFYQTLGFRMVFAYGLGTKVPEVYYGAVFEHAGDGG